MIINTRGDAHHNRLMYYAILSVSNQYPFMLPLVRFSVFVFFAGIVLLPVAALAQEIYTIKPAQRFSLGFSAGELSDNSWVGLEVTSPIMHHRISLRIAGSVHWLEAYKAQFDRWGTFSVISPAIVIYSDMYERSRWYMDIGPVFIIPQRRVSEKRIVSGVSTVVGIELFLVRGNSNFCYHFGVGLNYANAYADRLESSPRYSNGFIFTNGFRFYF